MEIQLYKISYIIVTYNRPRCIYDFLNTVIEYFEENNIGIYIFDGSNNNETYNIVNLFSDAIIKYYHCPKVDFTQRLLYGINNADSEYICICGDSQIPIVEVFDHVFDLLENNYDLINLSYRDNKHIGRKEYTDITKMFKDNAWDMTLFGTVFLKKTSYRYIDINTYIQSYGKNYFSHFPYYWDYLIDNNHFNGYYENYPIINISKYKGPSRWNVFEVFGKEWCDTIEKLNGIYDEYKARVILDHGRYSSLQLNRVSTFIILRLNGLLDASDFTKYKEYFIKITDLNVKKLSILIKFPKFFLYPYKIFLKGFHVLKYIKKKLF